MNFEWMNGLLRKGSKARKVASLVLLAAIALLVGYALYPIVAPRTSDEGDSHDHVAVGESKTVWTCSMHPQIQFTEPGLCPICFMDLIPLKDGGDKAAMRRISVSQEAAKLLDIETALVARRPVTRPVRMVGQVDYDETRLKEITAWVGGRLDRLYVDFTGVTVRQGDHLAELYSPELLGAQQELLQAVQSVRELDARGQSGNQGIVAASVRGTLEASRDKLRLLGLSDDQIRQIESSGQASDHVTISSPISGIVIEKNVQQGTYVETGTPIYKVADLSQVWVRLDAYEADLPWLRYGQQVSFTSESLPGEEFQGTITFIDPVLTEQTRTVKLRVNVANPDLRLKPGMFVRAVVESSLNAAGAASGPDLTGKWISPMHPEIIKDGPGECDVCGMPLVPAESLGLAGSASDDNGLPLAIPASAVLQTGKRAVVYVQVDPFRFDAASVTDWPELVARLRKFGQGQHGGNSDIPADPALRLWQMIDPDIRRAVVDWNPDSEPSPELKRALLADFNRLLQRRDLYQPQHWQNISLSDQAQGLLRRGVDNLPHDRLARLNRLLIESALPDQLASSVDRPTFEGRQIVLGPRAGDHFIVAHGLHEGQRVVTRGQFKLDSELQIKAKPSMMSPEAGSGAAAGAGHDHGGGEATEAPAATAPSPSGKVELPGLVRPQMRAVVQAGQELQEAAGGDDLAALHGAFAELARAVEQVAIENLSGESLGWWREYAMLLGNDIFEGRQAGDLQQARQLAAQAEKHLAAMQSTFGLDEHGAAGGAANPQFNRQLDAVVQNYLSMQESLAHDEPVARSKEIAAAMSQAIAAVDMKLLKGEDHDVWMQRSGAMNQALGKMAGTEDIEAARVRFETISDALIVLLQRFGAPGGKELYIAHCPMAFDNAGADWIQAQQRILNSYEGERMLRCGSIKDVIAPSAEAADGAATATDEHQGH